MGLILTAAAEVSGGERIEANDCCAVARELALTGCVGGFGVDAATLTGTVGIGVVGPDDSLSVPVRKWGSSTRVGPGECEDSVGELLELCASPALLPASDLAAGSMCGNPLSRSSATGGAACAGCCCGVCMPALQRLRCLGDGAGESDDMSGVRSVDLLDSSVPNMRRGSVCRALHTAI